MLWETILEEKLNKLGNERHLVLEQVIIAALDCNRIKIAEKCIKLLTAEFPGSLRVQKYKAMLFEALEHYDEAIEILDAIIKKDETNAAPRKRKIAILKAKGRNSEAIKEMTDYLKKFMSDQEAWHELCNLYLVEGEYAKAAFCMEEVLLHNPHSHLIHQRLAEIRYTMGGIENIEIAKSYYSQAIKLNSNNIRALYGLFLVSFFLFTFYHSNRFFMCCSIFNFQCCGQISNSKASVNKRKEVQKVAQWALTQISSITNKNSKIKNQKHIGALESAFGNLEIKSN